MNPEKFPPIDYSSYLRGQVLATQAAADLFARLEKPVQEKDFVIASELVNDYMVTNDISKMDQQDIKLVLGYHAAKFEHEVRARGMLVPFAPKEEGEAETTPEGKKEKSAF
jgi:hypothetical protein